ncbi:universal stress protein [bacterium]|jgi:nucleotide-binding universal stress UspA family protein|nr:universal stress protein [bacterium]NBT62282.1 universal stress protein [Planctomycetia bacterium]
MVGSCFHQISGDRAMITLKSILVPTDFSKQSQSAIRYGIEFAKKFGAKLHVLHVVQDVSIFIPEMGFINPSAALSNIEPMLLAAGKSLADFLEPYKHHGIELISHCQEGNPIDEIISLATDENIDLIILGTHGHTGLKHLFLGSLAETLVRKSPCPVLSLRNPEHEFVSS